MIYRSFTIEVLFFKMIVARMTSRLDARKIERECFSSHKRPRRPSDKPPCLCPAYGNGPSAGIDVQIFGCGYLVCSLGISQIGWLGLV
jgi:hypothetical protein